MTTLGSIEVDDVLINSNQPRVPGIWDVFKADPSTGAAVGGSLLRCQLKTGAGIPMPTGHYRVEVQYNTVEAGWKKDVHIIDVQ